MGASTCKKRKFHLLLKVRYLSVKVDLFDLPSNETNR